MKNGILLCCHGSRSNKGTNDTLKLLNLFKRKFKDYTVKIGYLEINKLTIKKQLSYFFNKKFTKLIIVPVMIFSGNHSMKDIPKIINSVKKEYSFAPNLITTKPLIFSKNYNNYIEKKFKNAIKYHKKNNFGLILLASTTINIKAKKEIDLLIKRLAKKNKINYYKSILVSLNSNKLRQQLTKIKDKKKFFILLPIFLFRGNLFFNLEFVVKKLNNNLNKKKYEMLPLIKNYDYICSSVSEQFNNT